MTIKNQNYCFLLLTYGIILFLVLTNSHNGFFWDTVQLASAHADFYYTHHFASLLLPDEMDSGHIPAFGMYVAGCWKLFGRTVETSHLAMLPFALGIFWQGFRLCKKFINEKYVGFALLLVLADPSLLSQITLVSPDVCLVFFFFTAINAILENKKAVLTLALILLFLTSMRGMMVAFCLLCFDFYINIQFSMANVELIRRLIKRSLLYLPALFIFLGYNTYHYLAKGWIGYHKDSPWAKCFERVDDFKSLFFNIGLYGWRLLDFGRIAIWIVLLILIVKYRKQLLKQKPIQTLGFLFISLMLFLPVNMLWAKNLMAHRYLIPIYLIVAVFTAAALFSDFVNEKLKYFLAALWLASLVGGNFIIYPPKVAKGWDSTLAHLPYYGLRQQAIDYLNNHRIDFNEVDSFFPNTASLDRIDLNHDMRNFENFTGKSRYVFYSNIFNIEDAQYDQLNDKCQYKIIKRFENKGVFIIIFEKLK